MRRIHATLVATAVLLVPLAASAQGGPPGSDINPLSTSCDLGQGQRNLFLVDGDLQSAPVGVQLPYSLVVRVVNDDCNPISNVNIDWNMVTGGGSIAPGVTATDADGYAEVFATVGPTAGSGNNTFSASCNCAGAPSVFRASATEAVSNLGPPANLVRASGDNQSGGVGSQLSQYLVVRVTDANGNGVPDVQVDWSVASGGGSVVASQPLTDVNGNSQALASLGTGIGTSNNSYMATVVGVSGVAGSPATFVASATAGPASALELVSGDAQSGTVATALPEPLVLRVVDAFGNAVSGQRVDWLATNGTTSAAQATSDAAGLAQVNATLGTTAGASSFEASAWRVAGATSTFGATAAAGPAAALTTVAGDLQTAATGAALAGPLVVGAADAYGNPVAGVDVAWSVAAGGGGVSQASTATDALGQAQVTATIGPVAGADNNAFVATVAGLAGSPRTFTASGTTGAAALIAKLAGDGQSAVSGSLLQPFVVQVTDSFGNVVSGIAVDWVVTAGTGSIGPATSTTDGSGRAQAVATVGAGSNEFTASTAGLAPLAFSATGTALAADRVALSGPAAAVAGDAVAIAIDSLDSTGAVVGGTEVCVTVSGGAAGTPRLTPVALASPRQPDAATLCGFTDALGGGLVEVTDTLAEDVTVEGRVASLPAIASLSIAFGPAGPDHLRITAADGVATACGAEPVALQVVDRYGNDVRQAVELTLVAQATSGAPTVTATSLAGAAVPSASVTGTTAADGSATLEVGLDSADTLALTWSSPALAADPAGFGPTLVAFEPGPADAGRSAFFADTLSIEEGSGRAALHVEARDACGVALAGRPVRVNSSFGDVAAVVDLGGGAYSTEFSALACQQLPALLSATVDLVSLATVISIDVTCAAVPLPQFVSVPQGSATAGLPYFYDADGRAEATGPGPITYGLVSGPAGFAVDAATGLVTWTPAAEGAFAVVIDATNAGGTVEQRFSVTVQAPAATLAPPAIVHSAQPTAGRGLRYVYDEDGLAAATGDGPITWTKVAGPPELSIDAGTGLVSWIPALEGDVPITIQAENAAGTDLYTFQVSVVQRTAAPPTAVVSVSPESGDAHLAVQADGSRSIAHDGAEIAGWRWDFGDGSGFSYGAVADHVYEQPGSFVVRLEVTDTTGATSESSAIVRANDDGTLPPVARIVASQTAAADLVRVALSCDCEEGSLPIAAYRWDLGDGTYSDQAELSYVFGPGGHQVRLIVTDVSGLSSSDTVFIGVADGQNRPPLLTASAAPLGGPAPLTVSFAAAYRDLDGEVVGSRWDFGSGATSTDGSPIHTFDEPGLRLVQVTVTDDSGLTSTAGVEINVTGASGEVAPQIVSRPIAAASAGAAYAYDLDGLPAARGDRPLAWSLGKDVAGRVVGAPAGMAVDAATGAIRWTPAQDQVGTVAVTLVARNGAGVAVQDWEIAVAGAGGTTVGPGTTVGDTGEGAGVGTGSPRDDGSGQPPSDRAGASGAAAEEGGCGATGEGGLASLIAGLVALGLWRRRRRGA